MFSLKQKSPSVVEHRKALETVYTVDCIIFASARRLYTNCVSLGKCLPNYRKGVFFMAKIKKRSDGRYAMQLYLGLSENKKRIYKTVYGNTAKEVQAKMNDLKVRVGKGMDVTSECRTFKQWADLLLSRKKDIVRASRYRSLNNYVNHLQPLWCFDIEKITTFDIENVLQSIAKWHDGKPPLSQKTLREIKSAASAVFELAIDPGRVISYNPARKVVIPRAAGAVETLALTDAQQVWVYEFEHRAKRAAMIMLFAGLRRGECAALTWADIDFKNNTISVKRAVEYPPNGPLQIKPPKTEAGLRTVDVPQLLIDYLKKENSSDDCLYILHGKDGHILSATGWKRLWASYMCDLNVQYGYNGEENKHSHSKLIVGEDGTKTKRGALPIIIETFTTKQLRHTFCTNMYFAGVDLLTAKAQMGHEKVTTTLAIYTHLDNIYKKKSMQKNEDYLLSKICKSTASQG